MKSKITKLLIPIFVVTLAFDILTKYLIKSNMRYGESVPVVDGFFNIVHALNPGAAFGFMRNMNEDYRQIFFVGVAIIAIILILFLLINERGKLPAIGYTLVLAGACGNVIDRIHTGHVVDFLDFYIGVHHWPAFNVADMCVTMGVAILLIDTIFLSKNRLKSEEIKKTN